MRRVLGYPIDSTRNSDDDGNENEPTRAISVASRVSTTATIGWTQWTIIPLAGGVGRERQRSRRRVLHRRSGLMCHDPRPLQKRVHTLRKGNWNRFSLCWRPFRTLRVLRRNRRGDGHLRRLARRQFTATLVTPRGRGRVDCLAQGTQGEVQRRPALVAELRSLRIAVGAEIANKASHLICADA